MRNKRAKKAFAVALSAISCKLPLPILTLRILGLLLMRMSNCAELSSLRGVGVYESDTFDGLYYGSYAGGGEITIAGYGFASNPALN